MNRIKMNRSQEWIEKEVKKRHVAFIMSSLCVLLMVGTLWVYDVRQGSTSSSNRISHRELERKYTFELTHKDLFPVDKSDVLGFICATLGLMVAAGGGIGGGGILVPILILVMGFSPKHAIPLSNVTVFGGAVANTLLNINKRHPLVDRPMVDWNLILVMEPLTIAGALCGAFLNKLLSETLLVVMLVALLSFTAYNTLRKAFKMYALETASIRTQQLLSQAEEQEEYEQEAQAELLSDIELPERSSSKETLQTDEAEHVHKHNEEDEEEDMEALEMRWKQDELDKLLEQERHVPWEKVKALCIMFVVVLFLNLMKGGGAFPSPVGIKCGSNLFWTANAAMLGWIFLVSYMARDHLVTQFQIKQRLNYPYVEGDIQWDEKATIQYPIICGLAGFFAGMFGVGGGIVKGPLLLAMGVHPKVSSASSACMILFTSFTATTSFIVFGLLIYDYAIICLFVGFIATYVGQIGLFYLMNKYERNSYIAFSIGAVVLLSAFLMTIQSIVSMAERKGSPHGSGGVCGHEY